MSKLFAWRRKRKLERLKQTVDHHCFTCRNFTFNEQGNRGCHYPGPLYAKDWINHICQKWEIDPDVEHRETGIYGIVR